MAITPASHDPRRREILNRIKNAKPEDKDGINAEFNMDLEKAHSTLSVKDTVEVAPVGKEKK